MAIAAYLALLCVWVLFPWPALRAPRGARCLPAAAAALGLAAALREAWLTLGWGPSAVGPIRLDIPLVCALLSGVYLAAALRLRALGFARTALLAGGVTLAAAGVMAVAWVESAREARRLTAVFDAGHCLLFEAKFENGAAYESYFGMTGEASDLPAGHWAAETGPVFTRLIVNPQGRAFLFYRCGDSECQFGPGAPLGRSGAGASAAPRWETRLVESGVGERHLALAEPEGDALAVRVDGTPLRFRRTPPPLLDRHAEEHLRYLSSYTAVERVREHARVSQIWLWRSGGEPGAAGGSELLAVGIFQYLIPGRRAGFVLPVFLGRGQPEGERWRFRWRDGGPPHEALVRLGADALHPREAKRSGSPLSVEIEFPAEGDHWPPQTLRPEALFRDDVIELAPRTTPEAWEHWFDTLLVGHFAAGEIPAL